MSGCGTSQAGCFPNSNGMFCGFPKSSSADNSQTRKAPTQPGHSSQNYSQQGPNQQVKAGGFTNTVRSIGSKICGSGQIDHNHPSLTNRSWHSSGNRVYGNNDSLNRSENSGNNYNEGHLRNSFNSNFVMAQPISHGSNSNFSVPGNPIIAQSANPIHGFVNSSSNDDTINSDFTR
jgi:hypothetical protein